MRHRNAHYWAYGMVATALLTTFSAAALGNLEKEILRKDAGKQNVLRMAPVKKHSSATSNKTYSPKEGDQEYLLIGKSMFDEEGKNAYLYGGYTVKYPVYVNFGDSFGKATVYGLLMEDLGIPQQPLSFDWDATNNVLSASTPGYFYSLDECLMIGEAEYMDDVIYTLNAGYPYGIGYWDTMDELVMHVTEDREVIAPENGFSVNYTYYDEWDEAWMRSGVVEAIYDVQMYKRIEGYAAYPSTDILEFADCFVNETTNTTLRVVNPGSMDADFVISSTSAQFVPSITNGLIEAGSYTEVEVAFTPDKVGKATGTLILQSEDTKVEITLIGNGTLKPDYNVIVKEGGEYISFNTSNEYPFELNEDFTGYPVAVSTNKGHDNTISWLDAEINIPEGKRAILSWEGYFYPRWAKYDIFTISNSEEEIFFETDDSKQYHGPISSDISLIEGKHVLRFAYEKGPEFNAPSVEMGEDYTYISSLSIILNDYLADAASLSADKYDFGSIYKYEGEIKATREEVITLTNNGYNALLINEIINSDHFAAVVSSTKINPENSAEITLTFAGDEFGEYNEDITLSTSAGDFKINCKAIIMEAPDYNKIVSQGKFTFEMGSHPFNIIDGHAVNDTSIPNHGEPVISEFSARFVVPEGKVGLLTWNGFADCGDGDYGMVMIDLNPYGLQKYKGICDAGNYTVSPVQCWLEKGEHIISFGFYQCGTSKWEGSNTLSISDLSLEMFDSIPDVVIWQALPAEFATPVYPGTSETITLQVWNMKEDDLAILSVDCTEPFACPVFTPYLYSAIPSYSYARLPIVFTPASSGDWYGEIKLETSTVPVSFEVIGHALNDDKLLFHDDFENGLMQWIVIDADGDGNTWSVGEITDAYSGNGALSFASTFLRQDSEDYILSPEITIPEDGATLSFYQLYTKPDNRHSFSVLVGEGADPSTYKTIYTERESNEYKTHELVTLSLDDFAGQTIRICLANKTPMDVSNLLIIDEFVVEAHEGSTSVNCMSGDIIKREYYTVDGIKVDNPLNGLYVVKTYLNNGAVITHKSILVK